MFELRCERNHFLDVVRMMSLGAIHTSHASLIVTSRETALHGRGVNVRAKKKKKTGLHSATISFRMSLNDFGFSIPFAHY